MAVEPSKPIGVGAMTESLISVLSMTRSCADQIIARRVNL
jgi:hypothetical protein